LKRDSHKILQDVFGYSTFRGAQSDIIENVIKGNDCLVIMPTGGGKSLCYQIPALAVDGLAVVVSPLIALMDDQVNALQQMGVSAASLHSNTMDNAEVNSKLQEGTLDILYVSPEKILSAGFLSFLQEQKIALFAIDEAH